jgi:hypothetical protein
MITTKPSLVCALVALFLTVGTAVAQQTNTAYGSGALQSNTTGSDNSAFGFDALFNNNGASANSAFGFEALFSNTNGFENTASGTDALVSNTNGFRNTASGTDALVSNTNGFRNTASGWFALVSNNTGVNDTADGASALQSNTTGYGNEASGVQALFNNTTGFHNTAIGDSAIHNNKTGHGNIGIGFNGGFNLTGSNNIEIGSTGTSADNNTIRLGTQGTQTATYVAGISGTAMTGADVVVSSSGRLGVLPSSARYKKDIQPLNERSQGLWQLRPVTFRYKQDPQGERQYGLIAEQVAKVYPELVVRGDKGEIESVQYRELIPLMLNEMQHQQVTMQHQQAALNELKTQNQMLRAALAEQNSGLEARLERLERLEQTTTIANR